MKHQCAIALHCEAGNGTRGAKRAKEPFWTNWSISSQLRRAPRDSDFGRAPRLKTTPRVVSAISHRAESTELRETLALRERLSRTCQKTAEYRNPFYVEA
jgi:hypothetical protein